MTKRHPTSRTPLLTPALAKTHRLGDAVSQALGHRSGHNGLAAPAMSATHQRRLSHGNGWGTPAQWQHGRVLHTPAPVATPSWEYPNFSRRGASVAHQGGIALLELMLVIGVVAIGTAGVVATYKVVDNNRKINNEVEHATTIAENIVANTITRGDFSQINQDNAIRDGVFPQDMLDADGNPKSVWGGDVLVTATEIDGKANWGSVLTFEGVPAQACAKLVTQAASGFYAVAINTHNVRTNYGPLDVAAVASLCAADNASVQFTYVKHGGAGGVGDPGAPCTVPAPEFHTVVDAACPSGQIGSVTYRTDYTCYSPYGTATSSPPVKVAPVPDPTPCAPLCVLPTPSSQTETQTDTSTRTLACPAGEASSTPGGGIHQSQPIVRTRTRSAFCAPSPGYSAPVGPYQWGAYSAWSAWAATAPWTTVSSDCATICTAPAPTTETRATTAETRLLNCVSGEYGNITQTRLQSQDRTISYTCPAPTGPYTTTTGSWGPAYATPPGTWTVQQDSCVACPTAITETGTQWVSASMACPSGQTGSRTWEKEQTHGRSKSYSCPAGTQTLPSPIYGAWSAWVDTGTTRNMVDTCATPCTLPSPSTETDTETRTNSQTYTCPNGQLITTAGTYQYDPSGIQTRGESRSRTRTATCPAPTGSYTWSAWSAFSTWAGSSPWAPSYACAPACTAPANTTQTAATTAETRTIGCPANYYGDIDQSRPQSHDRSVTYACPAPTGAYTTSYGAWGPAYATPPGTWGTTSNNCTVCPNLTSQVATQWVATSGTCPAGQTGSKTWEREQERTRTRDYVCPAGTTALPPITYGAWSAWANTGATRNVVNTCKSSCVIASGTVSRTWTVSDTCGPTFIPAGTYVHGAKVTLNFTAGNYRVGWTTGSATYSCNNGTFTTTATNATCAYEPPM